MVETTVDDAVALLAEHQHARRSAPEHELTAAARADLAAAQRTIDAYMATAEPEVDRLADETDLSIWHRAIARPRASAAVLAFVYWLLLAVVLVLATRPQQQFPAGLLLTGIGLSALTTGIYTARQASAWRRWRRARRIRL